ncbi:MAG: right-handed parallel beta-helix repeat-containing protein, partial [Thermoplasmata archaeon]|nr:right-handed parallel beta-helix repeat-containing protein [Thermoplasmata archaeon]
DNVHGIAMISSSFNTVTDNTMESDGVFITGNSLEHWNTHILDISNTVNGKPIHYWKNRTGGTIPQDAGEVILSNCQNIIIDGQNVSYGSVGIEIGFSSRISVTNNTASTGGLDGIYLYRTENTTVFGNRASHNGNNGISLYGSHTNTLANNVASWNIGDGIHLYSSMWNAITDSDLSDNTGAGVSLEHSDGNTVTDNIATSNGENGGYFYYSNGNDISNNDVTGSGTGLSLQGSEGNWVVNNTAIDDGTGIDVFFSSHNMIVDNTAVGGRAGIHLSESDDNTLIGNFASANHTGYWINSLTLWYSISNTLVGNVMVGNGLLLDGNLLEHWNTHVIDTSNTVNGRPVHYWKNATGGTIPAGAIEVILANCSNVVVDNQNLSGGTAGIELGFSTDNLLTNNVLSDNKLGAIITSSNSNDIMNNTASRNRFGISLSYSDFNDIISNTVSNSEISGISLYYSDNNSIASNDAWSNEMGIQVSNSNGNSVLDNGVISNEDGIFLSASLDTILFGNNIIDNTRQGYDNRDSSQWDNGYPIGGNFWSDYTGVDVMNGPNQNIPGSDGIGDVPYVIDADSEDRYPLMSPLVPLPPSAPLNLLASAGNQEVSLAWNTPSFDGGLPIVNYRIYRGTTPGGEVFHVEIGNVLIHLDTGLVNGQMYCYKVSAVNPIGEGAMSNEACATPTTAPGSPVVVRADLTGTSLENLTVTWNLSRDDGGRQNSVVGYLVYRGTVYDLNGAGYQLAATVPDGTTYFDDNMAGEGDPSNYFYRVCAMDLNNLTNCSKKQAGKFTRHLLSGPNLVSIPLIQSEENIETTLQTVKWDKAWTYDSSVQIWKSHVRFKPYTGELKDVNHSIGFWVNVTEQSNLTVAGLVPSSTTIHLQAGWNLLGFPSSNGTYAVSDLKTSVGVERIEGFDASTPPYFLRTLTDGEVLQTGFGYWIRTLTDGLWTVINS